MAFFLNIWIGVIGESMRVQTKKSGFNEWAPRVAAIITALLREIHFVQPFNSYLACLDHNQFVRGSALELCCWRPNGRNLRGYVLTLLAHQNRVSASRWWRCHYVGKQSAS